MLLLKELDVYSPEKAGKKDILIAGGKIIAIENQIDLPENLCTKLNLKGLKALPGFIDNHVHIAGAGGEGGPATRTPEVFLKDYIEGGITSVIGCLGTDGISRTVENLLMKAKALRAEGLSAWIYTGSYQVPPPTILGSVLKDLTFIDEIIAAGEIAIADHRSSHPSVNELIKLALEARVGGMLGGKAGILMLHMGDAQNPFQIVYDAVEQSELKFNQFLPTHCNRNPHIYEDSKKYAQNGHLDFTTSSYPYFPDDEIKPSRAVAELLKLNIPIENITLSSDAGGSLPEFDSKGKLSKLIIGKMTSLFDEVKDCVKDEKIPLEIALKTITSNVSEIFKLKGKGKIQKGFDADLVLVNDDLEISYVISQGNIFMKEKEIIKKALLDE